MYLCTKIFKKYYPLFILIICALICATRFFEQFIMPLDDEALYAAADYANLQSWSPAYKFYYHILNLITGDSFTSVYYNFFFLSIILLPLVIYLTFRNLHFNVASSAYAAIFSLIAEWNLSIMTVRIQIFSYLFILLAFNLRWRLKKNNHIIFYILLLASLYIRQDNVIILGCAFLWDLYHWNIKRKPLILICAFIGFYLLKAFLMHDLYSNTRQAEALIDHIWTNDRDLFVYKDLPKQVILTDFFGHPKTMWEVVTNRPDAFFHHIINNIQISYRVILKALSIGLNEQWARPEAVKYIFLIIGFITFARGIEAEDKEKINYKEIQLLTLALTLKCLAISILLNWWLKYYFELSLVMMIWIAILLTRFFHNKIPNRFFIINYSWPLIPYAMLAFYNYRTPSYLEINLKELIPVMRQENIRLPVVSILSGSTFYPAPKFEVKTFDPYLKLSINNQAKNNFKNFLHSNHIDTIVLYDEYRHRLRGANLHEEIEEFEKSYKDYSYELVHEGKDRHKVYRIVNEIYKSWNVEHHRKATSL